MNHASRPSVCHITSVHRASDIRIFFKQCRTLATAGYAVTLIAAGDPPADTGLVVVRTIAQARGRLSRMSLSVLRVLVCAWNERADVYHFHDPELIPVGILLRLRGAKVIYDVHESMPDQIREKRWLGSRAIRGFVAACFSVFERIASLALSAVVVAAPGIGNRFPAHKVITIKNYPVLSMIDDAPAADASRRPVMFYAGTLSRNRGVLEMLRAADALGGRIELWLAGNWHDPKFQSLCESEPGWRFTQYYGHLEPARIYGLMKAATIGLHVPRDLPNYRFGLAVKAFEYMACELPFVTSDELAKRAEFDGCAMFSVPGDAASVAACVIELLGSAQLRERLGRNGRHRVVTYCSWEAEGRRLVAFYDRLCGL